MECFSIARRAFESVGWNEAPTFTEEQVWRDEDIYHRELSLELGEEILPVRICWRRTDKEIREDAKCWLNNVLAKRPKEKWGKTNVRGEGKEPELIAALKNLAAMRLTNVFELDTALAAFEEYYRPNRTSDGNDDKGTSARNFRQRAVEARRLAAGLFHSGHKIARAETWTARELRLRKSSANSATMQ